MSISSMTASLLAMSVLPCVAAASSRTTKIPVPLKGTPGWRGSTLISTAARQWANAWSLVVPWVGIPLGDVIKRVEPTSKARFVEFTTLQRPSEMPGQREPELAHRGVQVVVEDAGALLPEPDDHRLLPAKGARGKRRVTARKKCPCPTPAIRMRS